MKTKLIQLLAFCLIVGLAHGQGTKISAWPSGSALNGTELLLGNQSGATVTFTSAQMKTYVLSSVSTAGQTGNYSDLSGRPTLGTLAGITVTGSASTGYVLTISGSGTYAWAAPTAGNITIGSNAAGVLTYSSGVLNFTNAPNTAGGTVTLDFAGNLITGLLGNYIGVTVQGYNANTTTLGNGAPLTSLSGTTTPFTAGTNVTITGTWPAITIAATSQPWELKSSSFTAVAGHKYQVDSSGTVVTMTLPGTATVMDAIEVQDATLSWATNNVTLSRNGLKINNGTTNYTANVLGGKLSVVYISSGFGWSIK